MAMQNELEIALTSFEIQIIVVMQEIKRFWQT